jgi:hypothetical protein
MLAHVYGRASDRKLRLFACACCRRIWPQLVDARSRDAVTVAERYADGLVDAVTLAASAEAAAAVWRSRLGPGDRVQDFGAYAAWATANAGNTTQVARVAAISVASQIGAAWEVPDADRLPTMLGECEAQAALMRDIFGDPFRAPPVLAPAWPTPAAAALAQDMYDRRSFERTRELADAWEAAGCQDAELLRHLRGPGPHVRGCAAVDAVLGKS